MTVKLDFSTIQNRYVFEVEVKLVTPLHIGGNQEEAITSDNPVIRDTSGKPFIPGSSIKGLLRTASERILHVLDVEKEACFLVKGGCNSHTKPQIKEIAKRGDERALYAAIYDDLCPVCRTYGGGSISSKVKFQHILFDEELPTRVRTSNSINRETGAAKDGALFNYEYIQPKNSFKLVIEAENMTTENLQVLALALAQLQQNTIRFGGKQAKGLGQVEYIQGFVSAQHFDANNKKQALATLLGLVAPEKQDLTDFLNTLLQAEVK